MADGMAAQQRHVQLCEGLLHRDAQAFRQLLAAGADPNSSSEREAGPFGGDTPLTRMGDLGAVRALIRAPGPMWRGLGRGSSQ